MRVAIVDDELYWRDKVKRQVEAYFKKEADIDLYGMGEEFLEENKPYDIVFMDIEMGEMDGFCVLEEYGKNYPNAIPIILTSHTEMSRKGYRVNAFRYIDKQELREIDEALESAGKKFLQEKVIDVHTARKELLSIKCKGIYYMESYNHEVSIYTLSGEIAVKEKLDDLEEVVKEYGFYRIHRSYLVNMKYISSFTRTEVTLQNGKKIYMSRRKFSEFKGTYLRWKFENGNG